MHRALRVDTLGIEPQNLPDVLADDVDQRFNGFRVVHLQQKVSYLIDLTEVIIAAGQGFQRDKACCRCCRQRTAQPGPVEIKYGDA